MNVGTIILANTQNLEMYGMCQRTINTLIWSTKPDNYHIVVVETNKDYLQQGFIYSDVHNSSWIDTITPNEPFGYNRFLNHGLQRFSQLPDWLIIANSDLIFTQDWFKNIMDWQKDHPDVLSLSPWEPNWHKKRGLDIKNGPYIGYRTSFEITGWCLVIHNSVITKCKLFDPQFEFWYQDNDYAKTLQVNNIKHALIPTSRVYHMVSGSHNTLTDKNRQAMTDGQLEILRKKWGPNI